MNLGIKLLSLLQAWLGSVGKTKRGRSPQVVAAVDALPAKLGVVADTPGFAVMVRHKNGVIGSRFVLKI